MDFIAFIIGLFAAVVVYIVFTTVIPLPQILVALLAAGVFLVIAFNGRRWFN